MSKLQKLVNGLYKVKIKGLEKIDLSERVIIAPNHTSLLDAAVLAANLPKDVAFVANTKIAKKFKLFMKGRKIIPVDPSNPYSVRKMVKVIESGIPLVIFPEGRITVTGGLMKIYDGTGYIAMRTGAKIYPVAIDGAERAKIFTYIADKFKTKIFPTVRLTVGNPFAISKREGVPMKQQKKDANRTILKKLQNELFNNRNIENPNLFNELIKSAQTNGMSTKIIEDRDGTTKYKKILIGSYLLGSRFKKLIKDNNNVGLYLPNSTAHVITIFSLFKIGKTPAILNFSMGAQTLIDCINTAEIKTVVTSREFIEKGRLENVIKEMEKQCKIIYLEDVKPKKINFLPYVSSYVKYLFKAKAKKESDVVLFTSGSESKPKGVVLTHGNIYSNIQQARTVIDFTSKDKMLNALPMFHSFGLAPGTLLPLLCGTPVYLFPSPLAFKAIPEVIYDRSATIIFGTSTFLSAYYRGSSDEYNFRSIRYAFAGAEKLREEVRQAWLEMGIRIFEGYGATETAPILSINTPLLNKKGSVGQLLPGIEYQIEKIDGIEKGGKLHVKGPNVMKGYLLDGQGFVPADEWYDTGDIVDTDEREFIHILSRFKRFAKIAGEMVPLNLVEEIASKVYKDAEVAAINIPDSRKGEKIILFVTDTNAKVHQMKEAVSAGGYTQLFTPSKIEYIDKLPILGSGKTDYQALKAIVEKN
jgi:acyl-[acyl-carrier-protein]-phospholipid O-acyltransferase/long-chain-fatty-acid--[acyl-carrier-protein] ligase